MVRQILINRLALKREMDKIDIGALINNVAMNHSIPTPFIEEDPLLIDRILQVNIHSMMKMTRMILPRFLVKKTGLIINVGSMAGKIPSSLLATYAASKAFMRSFSQSIAMEVKDKGILLFNNALGVHIEHVNTYFVTTEMSKIRKASFLAPTPKSYVSAVLGNAGHSISSTPYPSHNLLNWILEFLPELVI